MSAIASATLERIRLTRVSPSLAFADVRLPAVNLHSLKVEMDGRGNLKITPPTRRDVRGRDWPCYSLQPGIRENIETAIARLWALDSARE